MFASLYEGFDCPSSTRWRPDCPSHAAIPPLARSRGRRSLLFDPRVPEQIARGMVALQNDAGLRAARDAGSAAPPSSGSAAMVREYGRSFRRAGTGHERARRHTPRINAMPLLSPSQGSANHLSPREERGACCPRALLSTGRMSRSFAVHADPPIANVNRVIGAGFPCLQTVASPQQRRFSAAFAQGIQLYTSPIPAFEFPRTVRRHRA